MGRTPLIAGNWKMYKTVEQAEDYVQALLPAVSSVDGVDVALCVPFTAIGAVADSVRGSRVEVYAQNMHQAPEGAFTGEISGEMLGEDKANANIAAWDADVNEQLKGITPDRMRYSVVIPSLACWLASSCCWTGSPRASRRSCASGRRRPSETTTTPIESSASR